MISEYDAFGPWIYKIDEEHALPPLFVPYCKDNALLMLKFPRKIERRFANPQMELYDYVFAACEDELVIYKRVEHSVLRESIKYSDICEIMVFSELLNGRYTIYHNEGVLDIQFNTVSLDIIMEFTSLIRKQCALENKFSRSEIQVDNSWFEDVTDIRFYNLLN